MTVAAELESCALADSMIAGRSRSGFLLQQHGNAGVGSDQQSTARTILAAAMLLTDKQSAASSNKAILRWTLMGRPARSIGKHSRDNGEPVHLLNRCISP